MSGVYKSADDSSPTPVIGLGQRDLVKLFGDAADRLEKVHDDLHPEFVGALRKSTGKSSEDRRLARKAKELAAMCRGFADRVAGWHATMTPGVLSYEKNLISSQWLKVAPEVERVERRARDRL